VWNAPSKEALKELFDKSNTPVENILQVEEHVADSLVT
jgi:hypothetical protein